MSAFGIAVAITMYEELFDLCHIQHTRQIGPEKRVMPGSAVRARHIPGVRSGNRKRPLRLSASPLTLVAIYLSDWFPETDDATPMFVILRPALACGRGSPVSSYCAGYRGYGSVAQLRAALAGRCRVASRLRQRPKNCRLSCCA